MKTKPKCYLIFLVFCMILMCICACTTSDHDSQNTTTIQVPVVEIEKYGHVVLDITTSEFIAEGFALGDVVHVQVSSYESDMPFFDGYYTNPGTVLLRGTNAEAKIAICINYGDFSKEASVAIGDMAEISLVTPAGMLSLQELFSLQYSNHRADFSSDASFANFRAVTTGRIEDHTLYRTSSPINNLIERAAYANDLLEAAGVSTVLNLADSSEDIETFINAEDFDSAYYRDLYKAGKVTPLDLSGNFFSENFAISMAQGFTFLAQNSPPYAIHCTEGKDRAGFAAMLLEALTGAELEEITHDYMLSYYNYYGIDKETEPERYQSVLEINLIPMLCHITGAKTSSELTQIDLETAVKNYLLNAGMTYEDILILQEKLSGTYR